MTPSPARVAALLGSGMSAALAERLLSSPRFANRIRHAIAIRLAPLPDLDEQQRRLLDMDDAALATLMREAGAIHHARDILAIVNGPALRELVALIGSDLRAVAWRGRALAAPTTQAGSMSTAAIATAIPLSGAACLAAWCAEQPRPVAERLAFRVPIEEEPVQGGAPIIQFLLSV